MRGAETYEKRWANSTPPLFARHDPTRFCTASTHGSRASNCPEAFPYRGFHQAGSSAIDPARAHSGNSTVIFPIRDAAKENDECEGTSTSDCTNCAVRTTSTSVHVHTHAVACTDTGTGTGTSAGAGAGACSRKREHVAHK